MFIRVLKSFQFKPSIRVPWRPFAVFILAATTALGQAGSAGDSKSTIHFKNGDWLRGALAAYDPAVGVTWRHADATAPLHFNTGQLTGITLDGTAVGRLAAGNLCEVQLVNGDHFRGNLAGATAQHFLFDTWHAGRMQLLRSTVRKIAPLPKGLKTIFQGPESDDGWTHGKISNETIGESGNWRYHNGGFHAKAAASIARDLGLPDSSHTSFDLEWSGAMHLAFALYTDTLQPISLSTKENEPDFGGFYSIQVNSYSVNLLPVKKHTPLTYLGQATVPSFRNRTKARLEFFANKAPAAHRRGDRRQADPQMDRPQGLHRRGQRHPHRAPGPGRRAHQQPARARNGTAGSRVRRPIPSARRTTSSS